MGGPRPNYPPEKSAKFSQINPTDILSSRQYSKLLTKHDTSPILAQVPIHVPIHETNQKPIMELFIGISKESITLIPTIVIDYMKPSITIEWLMLQIGLEQS